MCLNCSEELRGELKSQIRQVEEEIRLFEAAYAQVQQQQSGSMGAEAKAQLEQDVAQAEQDVETYRKEVASLEEQVADLQRQERHTAQASEELERLEGHYWAAFNEFHTRLGQHLDDRDGLLAKIDQANSTLEALGSTSVVDDVFRIHHEEEYGTIAGLRLGLARQGKPDWEEMCAAWGHCVLLLHCIVQTCAIPLAGVHLLPLGSTSSIHDARGKQYPLYSQAHTLRLHIFTSDMDQGMTLFLAAVTQVGDFFAAATRARGGDPAQLPFPIDEDKVVDVLQKKSYSIRFSLNLAKWNKALKLMLTDLKFLTLQMQLYQAGTPLHPTQHATQHATATGARVT